MKAFLEIDVDDIVEVAHFAERLADRRRTRAAEPSRTDPVVQVPRQGPWTQADITQLVSNFAHEAVAHLLDMCAQTDGWVQKKAAEGEGPGEFTSAQLRAQLGAFTKRLKAGDLLDEERDYWPMEYRNRRGVYEYRLPPKLAAWWRLARASAPETVDES